MSRRFDPEAWLDAWMRVGAVTVHCASILLVANLDGNASEQRHLLGRLDGKRDRRGLVRDAALARMCRR